MVGIIGDSLKLNRFDLDFALSGCLSSSGEPETTFSYLLILIVIFIMAPVNLDDSAVRDRVRMCLLCNHTARKNGANKELTCSESEEPQLLALRVTPALWAGSRCPMPWYDRPA